MNLTVAYHRRSEVVQGPGGLVVSLAPNVRRDRVSFMGTLRQPLRFREAISALHDVVISDLRFKARDKSAYEAYLAEQKEDEDVIRRTAYQEAKHEILAHRAELIPEGLEKRYGKL